MWVVNVKVCRGTGDMLHQEAKVTRLIIPWNTLFIGKEESVINFIFFVCFFFICFKYALSYSIIKLVNINVIMQEARRNGLIK